MVWQMVFQSLMIGWYRTDQSLQRDRLLISFFLRPTNVDNLFFSRFKRFVIEILPKKTGIKLYFTLWVGYLDGGGGTFFGFVTVLAGWGEGGL